MRDKLGINPRKVGRFHQFKTFDSVGRDPRGHTLSIALYASMMSEVDNLAFDIVDDMSDMPFDHGGIVKEARLAIAKDIWTDPELVKEFLGEEFSTRKASMLITNLTGTKPTASNFNRYISGLDYIEKSDRVDPAFSRRPSTFWIVKD